MSSRRARWAALSAAVLLSPALVVLATEAVTTSATPAPASPAAAAPEVPSGFQDTVAISGLTEPTTVAFAADGTAFVGMKSGEIRAFDYAAGQYEPMGTSTVVIDLRDQVHNLHDRGLTGLAVDPRLGAATNPSNFVYVNYAYNRDPRDEPPVVPKWSTGLSPTYDDCPAWASMGPPPVIGCVINVRVSRIPMVKGAAGWVSSGPEQPLVEGACQQFSSHASGDLVFGADGYLYASAGDGASFDTEDWGQADNPCGDPADEGGSLRSQDIRTSGDPLSLSGAIFRIDKATGAAPNGATGTGSAANAARLVAVGQRNPWRMALRPGTNELWSGDVGNSGSEEINRTVLPGSSAPVASPVNLGWPCYEGTSAGSARNPGWDALDKPICEGLYAAGTAAVQAPYFSYPTRFGGLMTPGENCQQGTSSVSGVAFVPASSSYPAEYQGSLFFNDYARGCIWRLGKLADGNPDPATVIPFVEAAEVPVGIEIGPGGDLFYVDYGIVDGVPTPAAGDIHRIVYTPANQAPVARITASAPYGPALRSFDFDASGSTDANGDALRYEWALDGDGVYDDGNSTSPTISRTYTSSAPRLVRVRVRDDKGGVDVAQLLVTPGNLPPAIDSLAPSGSLTWAVGETVSFSAAASDPDQTLPDSAYSWSLVIEHCPSVCHSHPVTTWNGQRSGSFVTPDHEYPSDLLLRVTVTDDQGSSVGRTVKLLPKTAPMSFASVPSGAPLTVAGKGVFAPHGQTFIEGSNFNVVAPATREVDGVRYTFASWSDGQAAAHAVVAPPGGGTLTAAYRCTDPAPMCSVTVSSKRSRLRFLVDGSTVLSRWTGTFEPGRSLRVVAPKKQRKKGVLWRFVRWSDGGPRARTVVVLGPPIALKAVYKKVVKD